MVVSCWFICRVHGGQFARRQRGIGLWFAFRVQSRQLARKENGNGLGVAFRVHGGQFARKRSGIGLRFEGYGLEKQTLNRYERHFGRWNLC